MRNEGVLVEHVDGVIRKLGESIRPNHSDTINELTDLLPPQSHKLRLYSCENCRKRTNE